MVANTARERRLALELTSLGQMPPLRSGLREGAGGGVARLLLEGIYNGIADTDMELNRLVAYLPACLVESVYFYFHLTYVFTVLL